MVVWSSRFCFFYISYTQKGEKNHLVRDFKFEKISHTHAWESFSLRFGGEKIRIN